MRNKDTSFRDNPNPWAIPSCAMQLTPTYMGRLGMVIVLFRSRLTPEAGDDYHEMAKEMLETARDMPGFVDFKSFTAEDGERLSVIWWQDQETMAAWRAHPRHQIAQRHGRAKWYAHFSLEVTEVVRAHSFTKPD